jgi:hypothetical protein
MRWGIAAMGLVLVACGGNGDEGAEASPSPSHDLGGVFTISGDSDSVLQRESQCTGTGGYDDIRNGTQVRVSDEDGELLAVGSLGEGLVSQDSTPIFTKCHFPISVSDVPEARFYSIEVSHRGEISYSKAELEQRNWNVEFNL